MTGADGHGLCGFTELRDYLRTKDEEWLLKYVRENDGRFQLAEEEFAKIKLPSVRYQVACIFMLLGEYSVAETIHRLKWDDLSSWGDKVGNDLLKHFMNPWPQQ